MAFLMRKLMRMLLGPKLYWADPVYIICVISIFIKAQYM